MATIGVRCCHVMSPRARYAVPPIILNGHDSWPQRSAIQAQYSEAAVLHMARNRHSTRETTRNVTQIDDRTCLASDPGRLPLIKTARCLGKRHPRHAYVNSHESWTDAGAYLRYESQVDSVQGLLHASTGTER